MTPSSEKSHILKNFVKNEFWSLEQIPLQRCKNSGNKMQPSLSMSVMLKSLSPKIPWINLTGTLIKLKKLLFSRKLGEKFLKLRSKNIKFKVSNSISSEWNLPSFANFWLYSLVLDFWTHILQFLLLDCDPIVEFYKSH